MLYLVLKWVHILAVVAVVGAHITYGVWIVRASAHPEVVPFTLGNIKVLDTWIGLPAYGVLVITGFAMTYLAGIPLATPWLLVALALFAVLVVAHLLGYRPTLRLLIELSAGEGLDSPNYGRAAAREANLGIALTIVMIIIIFLMVVKPRF